MFSLEERMYGATEEYQKEKVAQYCKVRLICQALLSHQLTLETEILLN